MSAKYDKLYAEIIHATDLVLEQKAAIDKLRAVHRCVEAVALELADHLEAHETMLTILAGKVAQLHFATEAAEDQDPPAVEEQAEVECRN